MLHIIRTTRNKTIAEDTLIDIVNSKDAQIALRIFERNGRTVIQQTTDNWETVNLEIDDNLIRHMEQCPVQHIVQSRVEEYEQQTGISLDHASRALVHKRTESWVSDALDHIVQSAVDDATADNIIGTVDS